MKNPDMDLLLLATKALADAARGTAGPWVWSEANHDIIQADDARPASSAFTVFAGGEPDGALVAEPEDVAFVIAARTREPILAQAALDFATLAPLLEAFCADLAMDVRGGLYTTAVKRRLAAAFAAIRARRAAEGCP